MRRTKGALAVAWSVVFFLLVSTADLASQAPQQIPVGALSASGEVYVNGTRATGESTIFTGETLRTGADGIARVAVSGRGSLVLASQTQVSFVAEARSRYFAVLEHGDVGWRALEGAEHFQLRFRDFIIVPVGERQAAAEIVLAADGSGNITCVAGSVGLIQLDGPQAIFIDAGEVAALSADGALLKSSSSEGPPSKPAARKSRRGLYVLIGLAGAGGAGAAIALSAGRKSRSSVSPSTP